MNKFQKEIKDLPDVLDIDAWSGYRNKIREEMMSDDDWGKFKTWPTIAKTLYCGRIPNTDAEYDCVLGSRWANDLDIEDGTAIHQAYGLWLFQEQTGHEFKESDTFLEFGGGYGEMARMVWDHVRPKQYTIYDFPELNVLQRYYIEDRVGEFDGFSAVDSPLHVWRSQSTVFISICAISEAPVPLRDRFLGSISPKNLIIRYQARWDKVDNKKYFLDFARANFANFHNSPAPEYSSHFYLIAWNRKK